ncbi:MAG: efflux RND transporter permease subunit, partial [Deltaproteobacteria bacterium]|nr:efflux RND transporter permease subunit [Deltaproteobacteria bacterium]
MNTPASPPTGLIGWMVIKQEVFPAFELDIITIRVSYPGAGPEEIEQGILLAVEEAIQGVEGIKEMTATARESSALIRVELLKDAEPQKILRDIQQKVDGITTFPVDAEAPVISIASRRRQVLRLNIYGNIPERSLLATASQVRDRLLQNRDISQVELQGGRDYEINVAVPLEKLRKYGLTLA